MTKVKLLVILFVFVLIISAAGAQTTTLRFKSKVDPKKIIDEIKTKPSILYFAVGKFYYNMNNYDAAQKMFEKTIEINPGFAPGHYNLGVVYYELEAFDFALLEIQKASELDLSYVQAHYSLGILNFELGDFDHAIDSFRTALDLDPNNPNYNFDLAQSYVARFRTDEPLGVQDYSDLSMALFYLNKTLKMEPTFPQASNNIMVIESVLEARNELLHIS